MNTEEETVELEENIECILENSIEAESYIQINDDHSAYHTLYPPILYQFNSPKVSLPKVSIPLYLLHCQLLIDHRYLSPLR